MERFKEAMIEILQKDGWGRHKKPDPCEFDLFTKEDEERNIMGVRISLDEQTFKSCGYYGAANVEIHDFYPMPYDIDDLEKMKATIFKTEKSLLENGVPFCSDYKFSGSVFETMLERNRLLRADYKLDQLEAL